MIKSIMQVITKFLDLKKVAIDKQITTEVIDDKNDLEKACRYAEQAFSLVEDCAYFDTYRDKRRFDFFLERFRKYK